MKNNENSIWNCQYLQIMDWRPKQMPLAVSNKPTRLPYAALNIDLA
jgi:hypothetical protein